jgi:hypothetical protein
MGTGLLRWIQPKTKRGASTEAIWRESNLGLISAGRPSAGFLATDLGQEFIEDWLHLRAGSLPLEERETAPAAKVVLRIANLEPVAL